jgi:predicted PurR-regulated permease PerM
MGPHLKEGSLRWARWFSLLLLLLLFFIIIIIIGIIVYIFISVSIIYFIERVKDISNLEEPKFRSVNKKIKKKDKKKKKNIEALLIAEIEFLL